MSLLGSTLGHIRVVDVLGSGGIGELYVGYDEKLKRKVALKALQRSVRDDREVRARLLREARILSQLDHPNICRIYDFIEKEETDYLVLELIEGTSLKVAIRKGLASGARMRVARQIAEVLTLAHERGVIHRDLKPDNVMLTPAGDAKVLDFGLARLVQEDDHPTLTLAGTGQGMSPGTVPEDLGRSIAPRTLRGSVMGTLTYMSPEQARGEPVSAASDIYSFGLVLQEVFSGRPVHDPSLDSAAVLERAQRGETEPVTGVDRELARLIERMKAVAPSQRPSAREVSDRLRWIDGRGSRRLRRALATAAVVALVGGLFKYTVDLRRERAAAVAARAEAEQVIGLLVDLFEVSDPSEARGRTITAREVLDRGAARISAKLADQPLVRARLALTIAHVYEALGLLDDAARLAAQALETRREMLGDDHLEVAEASHLLGDLQRKLGNFAEAEALMTRAVELRERYLGPVNREVASSLNTLAVVYENWGKLAEAEEVFRRAQSIQDQDPHTDDAARSRVLSNLAVLAAKQGKDVEAEALFREVVSFDERTLGFDHPQLAVSYSNLGIMLKRQRKFDEASELYRRALAIQERALPPAHPSLANTITNLANLALETHDYPHALELYDRSRAILEQALGPEHPSVALVLKNLGQCQREAGDSVQADTTLRRALAIYEQAVAPESAEVAYCLAELALVQLDLDRPEEARKLAGRALAIEEATLPADDSRLIAPLHSLALAARRLDERDLALAYYRRAIVVAERNPHLDPDELAELRGELAELDGAASVEAAPPR